MDFDTQPSVKSDVSVMYIFKNLFYLKFYLITVFCFDIFYYFEAQMIWQIFQNLFIEFKM
jgi:hypothetical protein